jgi:activating signal cointegrator 1
VRALTLWQPWASLVACGAKRWETRRWGASYRGPVLIHAALRRPPSTYNRHRKDDAGEVVIGPEIRPAVVEAMIEALGVSDFDRLPRGAVVATAELAEVRRIENDERMHELIARAHGLSMAAARHEWLFGDWTPGHFAWGLDHVRPVEPPVPAAGARRLWVPSLELLARIPAWRKACPECRIGPDEPFIAAVLAAKDCVRCHGTGWVPV